MAGLRKGEAVWEAREGRTEVWTEALIARGTLERALRDMVGGLLVESVVCVIDLDLVR